ncbi:unnamed protein product [Paramecium sonneborni]|uniref:Uncharacterized protein n=1 Tax=Paramecium sonneborni TaxID=65129 RepID=A0A8S1M0I6_9CILI|nr:unnamed protein product [Paramecium sonneborni]
MNNIINSFSPIAKRNPKIRTENIDFKMKLFQFEPLNINTQPIKQIRIKIERKLSPIFDQNYNALFLNKIKVQKMALKKAKLSQSIDCRALPELDLQAQLQIIQPTTLVLPSTQRNTNTSTQKSTYTQITQSKKFKFKDNSNSQFESERKGQQKVGFRLPKIDKTVDLNESISSLNCWTMNSSSGLLQPYK